jgi:hypothetical protein
MKVLIWIGCMILNYIIQNISAAILACIPVSNTGDAALIGLFGGLLSAASIGFCIWLAITLCKKWEWYNVLKKASEANMTISEYGKQGLSEEFLAKLEEMCHTIPYEQVKSQLKACVKKGKITKEQYIILLNEYSTTK